MKKFIFLLTLLALTPAVFLSCEKVDVDTSKGYVDFFAEDTPQSLIVQMQGEFTIEQVTKTSTSYTVTFHNPSHFVSKTGKVYPEGIRTLTVAKEQVTTYQETANSVVFKFKPYHRAELYYYNKQNPINPSRLTISYDNEKAYRIKDYNGTVDIPFVITENTTETELKLFLPSESKVTAELIINPDKQSGVVRLSPNYEWDFDEYISFEIGTEAVTDTITVQVIRKVKPLFLDNNSNEITLELDDIARTWWVNLTYNKNITLTSTIKPEDEDYTAQVTNGNDWITLGEFQYRQNQYPLMSKKGATLFLNFKHFIGSGTRTGTVIVKRKGCDEELKVNVIQSGSENPGSIRGALMALYNQCGGSEWKLQENWCSDLDVEEWCGISFTTLSVNEEYRTESGYMAKKLKAYGPPELTAMIFNFWTEGYWNVITGKIPDEFWNIKCGFRLFTVCFVENADINKVPPSMWTPKLRNIRLCNMQNGKPAYLCTDLSNISKAIDAEEITLHGKNFSGQLPDDIGKMKKLKTLEIHAFDLKTLTPIEIGPCPASIVECESLEYLYLATITNTIPDEIIYLPNIKCCEYVNKELGYFCLIDR